MMFNDNLKWANCYSSRHDIITSLYSNHETCWKKRCKKDSQYHFCSQWIHDILEWSFKRWDEQSVKKFE